MHSGAIDIPPHLLGDHDVCSNGVGCIGGPGVCHNRPGNAADTHETDVQGQSKDHEPHVVHIARPSARPPRKRALLISGWNQQGRQKKQASEVQEASHFT